MKTLWRRIFYCWLNDRHWTMTYHGYWPSRWAHCSCCGELIMEPHEVECLSIAVASARVRGAA